MKIHKLSSPRERGLPWQTTHAQHRDAAADNTSGQHMLPLSIQARGTATKPSQQTVYKHGRRMHREPHRLLRPCIFIFIMRIFTRWNMASTNSSPGVNSMRYGFPLIMPSTGGQSLLSISAPAISAGIDASTEIEESPSALIRRTPRYSVPSTNTSTALPMAHS